jgi:spermidine/putrescine-binding protein
MTATLIRVSLCLAILAATIMTLVIIPCIASRRKKCTVRILMFSSFEEADRAAFIASTESRNSSLVTHPRYVAEIDRYFVVIEEALQDKVVNAGESPDGVRPKS